MDDRVAEGAGAAAPPEGATRVALDGRPTLAAGRAAGGGLPSPAPPPPGAERHATVAR
jgi:hypothetical protein